MTEEIAPSGDSERASPRVSLRFVLVMLLGLYLAGFGLYRINNEPPKYPWLGYSRYYTPDLEDYQALFTTIWESDEPITMKIFHTLYSPCYVAEEWMIYNVLW